MKLIKTFMLMTLTITVTAITLCGCRSAVPVSYETFTNDIVAMTPVVEDITEDNGTAQLSFLDNDVDDDVDDVNDDVIDIITIEPEPSTENVVETEEPVVSVEVTPEPVIEDTAEPVVDDTANDTVTVDIEPSNEVTTNTEPTIEVIPEPEPVTYINGQFPLCNYTFGSYVGRITVPSVGVDVAVYHSNSQNVVDAVDSAGAYYAYETQPDYANYTFIIADHNYQGFNAIKQCSIGTEAFITTNNGTYRYVCDRIILNGHNTGSYLADENYNCIYSNEGGMWLQTCNDCWQNDTLIHFHAT